MKRRCSLIEDRYANALDIAEDIRSWLDGADRKEKAMKILSQVQEIEHIQAELMNERYNIWTQADDLMNTSGIESDTAWDLWEKSLELREEIEENRQEMHQLLQGALIYDPELTETHQKLVAFEYEDYLSALLDVDKRRNRIFCVGCVSISKPSLRKRPSIGEREQKDNGRRLFFGRKGVGLLGAECKLIVSNRP